MDKRRRMCKNSNVKNNLTNACTQTGLAPEGEGGEKERFALSKGWFGWNAARHVNKPLGCRMGEMLRRGWQKSKAEKQGRYERKEEYVLKTERGQMKR